MRADYKRDAIALRLRCEGLGFDAIAKHLGISNGRAQQLVKRARKMGLRKRIQAAAQHWARNNWHVPEEDSDLWYVGRILLTDNKPPGAT